MSLQDNESAINEIECKNCHMHFQGSYCSNCGQKVITERNTLKHFFNLFFDSFDIHRGVLFTAKLLFLNPGKIINEYLNGKTKDYYNPLRYLLIVAGIYAIFMLSLNVIDANIESTKELFQTNTGENKLQSAINSYLKKYLSFIPILVLPFWSLASKWILKKYKLYYAEHLIINSYLYAQYLLILTLVSFVLIPFPELSKYVMIFGIVVITSYFTYAYRSIFKISTFKSLFSSLSFILLGLILFYVFIMLIFVIVIAILMMNGVNIKELVQ